MLRFETKINKYENVRFSNILIDDWFIGKYDSIPEKALFVKIDEETVLAFIQNDFNLCYTRLLTEVENRDFSEIESVSPTLTL